MRLLPVAAFVSMLSLAHAEEPAEASPHALCEQHADAMLTALGEANYEAARADFDEALRARYTAAALKHDYEWLPSNYGKVLGRGRAHSAEVNARTVVMTPLIYENGTSTIEVHCDAAGAIAELKLLPTQAMGQPLP